MNLIALTKHISVGGLSAIGCTEYIHRCSGKERMAVNIIASRCGYVILLESFFKCLLGGSFTCGCLRSILGAYNHFFTACCRSGGSNIGRILFGSHLVDDTHNPALVVGILCGRNIIHINAVFHKTGTYFGLIQTAFL